MEMAEARILRRLRRAQSVEAAHERLAIAAALARRAACAPAGGARVEHSVRESIAELVQEAAAGAAERRASRPSSTGRSGR